MLCGTGPHPRPTNPWHGTLVGWSGGGVGRHRAARQRL